MKILTILGARPQFIKAAPLSLAFKNNDIQEVIVHTGQHYDFLMSDVFFNTLKLPTPSYKLHSGSKSHAQMTANILVNVEKILLQEKPDFTLVYGDTNSTLAGALASSKLNIPIIHVESGLRSFDHSMPEEINRIITDKISKLLFCPTNNAVKNLKNEGFKAPQYMIQNVGDIMLDSSKLFVSYAKKPNFSLQERFALCTLHRAQNTDTPEILDQILDAIHTISKKIQIIFPIHPRLKRNLYPSSYPGITFCDPLNYFEMIWLLQNTQLVFTDSGGLQKESYFFKKPCIVLRETSEWIELIKYQYNFLVGSNKEKILATFDNISQSFKKSYKNFYGDGDSAQKIIQTLKAL
ncbi:MULTISPECIES: non-hydrolyzing UDP-N-acetylglucosamine 2-epimerase [unclassified Helicobacter]|uniref:non-hydrolyzing UDP-N-acetylglucosamine 2-epimerase n=1 Tax=unclassified Helicobacter TaxID=2593540 RepID=UPI000CF0F8CC|nr:MULTISPECIES: UDP-N-acetylglucosamine 2-epimerase (non-hydrolyzing) [unclassified Helicobacter]